MCKREMTTLGMLWVKKRQNIKIASAAAAVPSIHHAASAGAEWSFNFSLSLSLSLPILFFFSSARVQWRQEAAMRRVHIHMHADIYTHILHVQRRAVGSALNYSLGLPCHSQALFCRPACLPPSLFERERERELLPADPASVWREEEEKS